MTWQDFAGSVMKPRRNEPGLNEPGLTTARLRHEIDSGRAGDKIDNCDPAAAPLGTDEEAAGTPPSREAVRVAMAHEVKRPRASPQQHDHGVNIFIAAILGLVLLTLAAGYALKILI